MKFLVEGVMGAGKSTRSFVKEVTALNENVARETAVKLLGSAHKLKRNAIRINAVRKAE